MILIPGAGLASRSNGPWLGKGGCRNFQRGCCQKIHIRKEPLGRENVRPACQSVGNSWQRQGSCHILQGLYFLPARRNSGSPTLKKRNLWESILPTPPGTKTVVRCDQPCQDHQKQPQPLWAGQSGLHRVHVWGCEPAKVGLCSERGAQGKPKCSSAPAQRRGGHSMSIPAGLGWLISKKEEIKVLGSVTALH